MDTLRPPMKGTIWITGAAGLIGSALVRSARQFAPEARVIGLTRADLELTDFESVETRFRASPPDAILHCAALSRSQVCQADPVLAERVNVEVSCHLAGLADGRPFVFLSTDLVFDGQRGGYREEDPVNPLSTYAETKAAAEDMLRRQSHVLIVRTSLTYGSTPAGNRSFNEELVHAWRAGRVPRLFTDEYRCPIAADVTAQAIWELLKQGASGVLHVAGAEKLSRHAIGQLVARRHPSLQPRLEAASLRSFEGPPRPPDVSLDCSRAAARLSFRLPGLTEWLDAHEPVAG